MTEHYDHWLNLTSDVTLQFQFHTEQLYYTLKFRKNNAKVIRYK